MLFRMMEKRRQVRWLEKFLARKQSLEAASRSSQVVINAVVNEVNSLSLAEQKAIVEANWPETQKKGKS